VLATSYTAVFLAYAQVRGNATLYSRPGQGLGAHLLSDLCARLGKESQLTSSCVKGRDSAGHRVVFGTSLPSCAAPACYTGCQDWSTCTDPAPSKRKFFLLKKILTLKSSW